MDNLFDLIGGLAISLACILAALIALANIIQSPGIAVFFLITAAAFIYCKYLQLKEAIK